MRNFLFLLILIFFLSGCSGYKITHDHIFPSKTGKAEYIKSYNHTLTLWDVQFEETDVITSLGLAHVIISGPKTGEPVILFHGTDASSTMWFPNVKELSKNFRVYAIDFPLEAGKSVAYTIKLKNKETAVFYNEIFEHFKLTDINLIGVSRGGWMVTYLAVQPNNKIKKIVLLSPAQTFGGIHNLWKVLSALKLKTFPSRKNMNNFFNSFSLAPDKINGIFKEQLYLAYKYGNSKPRLLKMTRFSEKDLRSIKIPTLVLVGDHDIVNTEKIFVKAHKLIPNVETAVIKDAGHFISIDQSEIINKKIIDFLSKN